MAVMTAGITDYIIIFVYLLIMTVVGIVCTKLSRNVSDYLRAGGQAAWWLAGTSMFMTGFSALTFTGIGGQAFAAGFSPMMIFWGNALGFFIQAAFLAHRFRQTRAITSVDNVRSRFGAATEQLFVYTVPFGLLWGGIMLLGTSKFVSVIFGMPLLAVIFMIGVVAIFYSVTGGSWSCMVNDYLHGLILLAVTLTMAVLSLIHIGGLHGIFAQINSQNLVADFQLIKPFGHHYQTTSQVAGGLFTPGWVWATLLGIWINVAGLTATGRYLSVKDGRDARKAAILGGFLMLLGSFIFFIPPMVARLLYAHQVESIKGIGNAADAAYAFMCLKLLPIGLSGLVVTAMFSATMSVLDGCLTGSAGQIVQNMYPPLCRLLGWPERTGKARLHLVKFVNLAFGLFVVAFAIGMCYGLSKFSLYTLMIEFMAIIAPAFAGPMVGGLFVRRTPPWAPVAAILVGLAASAALNIPQWLGHPLHWNGHEVLWHQKMIFLQLFSLGAFLGSMLFYRPSERSVSADGQPVDTYDDRVDRFFRTMGTPVDFDKEIGKPTDLSQLRMIGLFGLLSGAVLLPLLLLAHSKQDVIIILSIVAFIVFFAALLLVVGLVNKRRLEQRVGVGAQADAAEAS
jgi:SSS family solute:Na+ symporter